jgi:biopolymer transport protein ExbD
MGIGVVAESALAAVIAAEVVPVAFITTVAGLLVAIPAAWSYNYLRTRIDLLEIEISGDAPVGRSRPFRVAQKFPLAPRYSTIPFPLMAAPILAILVGVVFMEYSSYQTPMGLSVSVVPARCDYEGDDRLIVLRLTDAGKLFINQTQEDWNSLPDVLSKIFGLRAHRTLYLLAEDGVPFQTVADALDSVENVNVEPHPAVRTGADKLGIKVRLITPKAMNTSCVLEPVAIGSSQHASR